MHFLPARPRDPWPIACLLLILLVSLGLRYFHLGVAPFGYDEALVSRMALRWVEGGALPLVGMQSSLGVHFPPWPIYLLAPPLLIQPVPLAIIAWIALLDVAAVGLVFLIAWKMAGRWAACTAALLYATAPWALFYARALWSISLNPFLSLLLVGCAVAVLLSGRRRWAMALLPLAAIIAQLHFSGAVMVLWLLLVLLLFARRVPWGWLGAGLLPALLTFLPYLAYQRTHYREELAALRERLGPSQMDAEVLRHMARLATGADFHSIAGAERFRDFLATVPFATPLSRLIGIAVALALLRLGWLALHRTPGTQRDAARLLLLWAVAPLPFFIRHGAPVQLHYLTTVLPLFPLALAVVVGGAQRTMISRLALAATLLVAVSQATTFVRMIRFADEQATPGGLGIPLTYWQQSAQAIALSPVCEVKIISDGAWPIWDEQPAIFDALLPHDPRLLYFDAATLDALPPTSDGRTLLVMPPLRGAASAAAREVSALPQTATDIPLRRGEGTMRLIYQDGGRSQAVVGALDPVTFANGVKLLGYAVAGQPRPGSTIRLFLHWQLIDPPSEELHAYNHLLAADGAQVGQQDGFICAQNQWHVGQRVWTWYDLQLAGDAPPGPYQVRTGLYGYPSITNVLVVADDNTMTDGVTLPLP